MTAHRHAELLLALVLLLLATGCAGDGPERVLLQADRDFQKATFDRGVEGWMTYMAPEAVLDSNGKPVVGHQAIRADRKLLDDPRMKLMWEPLRGELFAAGDFGYTTGTWKLVRAEALDKPVRAGRYLTVWRKSADGSWKVIWDGGAADPVAGQSASR